jgi:RND family efflux transporter MFP subunit
MNKLLKRPFILFAIAAVGGLIAVILVSTKAPLQHAGSAMASRQVEVITAKRIPFRAAVTAYGSVEPTILLNGMAEVSGKASYVHAQLKRGNSLPAGTTVVRIDPEDYQVTLKQTQADLAANRSSLTQLEQEEESTRQSLQLAKRNLEFGEQELARKQDIFERQLIARSTLDAEEQKALQLRQQVEQLQGQLNAFDSRKANVSAQIIRAEQQVKGQETALGRTEIKLPFDARIGAVSIEQGEFVSVGTPLFEALNTNGVEINAQLPVLHMRALVSHFERNPLIDGSSINVQRVLQSMNLTASVRMVGGMPDAYWDARVLRLSASIDPTRRTLGIVVGIDNPYEKVIPGKRPPLLKGMYTAVDIFAPEREALVVPRKAVHQGRVYVADPLNKLAIKAVTLQFQQGDLAVIESGLEEGEQIIINDLSPVIEGMPLEPIQATEFEEKLLKLASGSLRVHEDTGNEPEDRESAVE